MDQTKKVRNLKDLREGQFLYLDRWVNKDSFCAFIYDEKGNQTLAKNYDHFIELTSSGIWFATKPVTSNKRKLKDAFHTNS